MIDKEYTAILAAMCERVNKRLTFLVAGLAAFVAALFVLRQK